LCLCRLLPPHVWERKMNDELEKIMALQDMARRIEIALRDRDALSVDVRNKERVVQDRKRRAAQLAQLRIDTQKKGDSVQLQIEEIEGRNAKMTEQLNVTKHQKDYDVIKKSIASHEADIQKLEDEELTCLATIDELAEQIKQAKETVTQTEVELEQVKKFVAKKVAEYDRKVDALKQEVAVAREDIRPGVLSAWERMAASRMLNPLAIVRNRVCQGCFTQITPQTFVRLRRDDEIVNCSSCSRLLMLQE
jgi:uncharacterized protein